MNIRFWGLMVLCLILGVVIGAWWLIFLAIACIVAYLLAIPIATRRARRK